jgi:hypothetical protein
MFAQQTQRAQGLGAAPVAMDIGRKSAKNDAFRFRWRLSAPIHCDEQQ